jgi:archaellin
MYSDKMGNIRATGITLIVLLISMILIAMTVASIITDSTSDPVTEDDLNQITQETVDELCSIIQIRDQKGKFYDVEGSLKLKKIAIMISPLVTQEMDLSKLSVQLDNGNDIVFLTYGPDSTKFYSSSIFEDSIWDKITGLNFGLIALTDKDNSINEFNVINDYGDNAYLIFELPDNFCMQKGEKLSITLYPEKGVSIKITVVAPLPMTRVVSL